MHASLEHSSMAGALPSDDFGDDLIAEVKHLRAFAVSSFRVGIGLRHDLLQETLLRAWSKSTQFRDGTNLRAWLLTILRNSIFYSSLLQARPRGAETVMACMRALSHSLGRSGRPSSRSAGLSQGIGQASGEATGSP